MPTVDFYVFTPTEDVDNLLRRRRRLMDYKSLKTDRLSAVDGICCRIHEFYYIGDRRRSLWPIPIQST